MPYLRCEDRDDLIIVFLDQPDDKVNKLNAAILAEFPPLLDAFAADDKVLAMILVSAKPDNFIVGADIEMFAHLREPGAAAAMSRAGHELLDRLENFPKPIIAAIHGTTLGGGLEVALACHYRIAGDSPKTVFGLPEVKLGLLPGAGGTQRLPRLIGLQRALDIMLTGKNVYARKAKSLGLIDELVPGPHVLSAAIAYARDILRGTSPRKDRRTTTERALEATFIGRQVIYRAAEKQVMKLTAGNYPAPLKILEVVKTGLEKGLEAGYRAEAEGFEALVRSPESQNLIRLFFGMNAIRKNPFAGLVRPIQQIGILGSGLMGSGIAEVSIATQYQVFLKDLDLKSVGKGVKFIGDALSKQVRRKVISSFQRDFRLSHLHPADDTSQLSRVQLVIEAVFEDLELKRRLLEEVETHCPNAIFATNTSSLPIGKIAEEAKHPERVIGMHYFSPVPKMPLLEIIVTPQTADWVKACAYEVGIRQGKHLILVQDGPGFFTTRILAPMLNEAILLLEEGAEIRAIDRAMIQFGFPVGPITLIDEVGIDVGAHVGKVLGPLFAERGAESNDTFDRLFAKGYLGRKNGKGFYRYDDKKKPVNSEIYAFFGGPNRKAFEVEELQQRLALILVNEAAHCLGEGILASAKDGDLGAILGLGFPPFLGGPFSYMDSVGVENIRMRLEILAGKLGARFKPAPILSQYSGLKFRED